jgi:hypothetical protein
MSYYDHDDPEKKGYAVEISGRVLNEVFSVVDRLEPKYPLPVIQDIVFSGFFHVTCSFLFAGPNMEENVRKFMMHLEEVAKTVKPKK